MIKTPNTVVGRSRRAVALVLGAAFVFVACGDDDAKIEAGAGDVGDARTTNAPEPSPETPVSNEPGDDSDPGSIDIAYQRVTPIDGLDNLRASAFDATATVVDGETLLIRFVGGVAPCFALGRVDVVETDTDITVTLFTGNEPEVNDGPTACIEIAAYYEVEVQLEAPAGDRTIVDGAR